MKYRSLGWEDHLEQEMATHSSILAWRIPWTEEPGRLQSMGTQRVGHDGVMNTMATNTNVYIVSKSVPYTQKLLRRQIKMCRGMVNRDIYIPYEESLFM